MVNLFRKESQVEKLAKEHVQIVHQSIHKLKIVLSHFYIGDFEKVDKEVTELSFIMVVEKGN